MSAPPGQLRVSHVWRDEVMDDLVLLQPKKVTLGENGKATFTTPQFDLPKKFAILRPGKAGYVLTLGPNMAGTVKLGGREMQVAEFIAHGGDGAQGAAGGFRATPVNPGDWGVIELDGTGHHKLFFQFVPQEAPLPKPPPLQDSELLLPSLAFAGLFGLIFLSIVFLKGAGDNPFLFPGDQEVMAEYIVSRPPEPIELDPEQVKAGTDDGEKDAKPASSTGKSGKSGGEGKKPRKRAPDPDEGEPDEVVAKVRNTGLLRERSSFDKIAKRGGFDKKLGNAMAKMQGLTNDGGPGGSGAGKGTGVGLGTGTGTTRGGKGKGVGGGGTAHGDVVTTGVIRTGGKRPPRGVRGGKGVKEVAVKLKTGKPTGSMQGLTPDQILRVVKARQNAIKACYERQLQRSPKLAGKIDIQWKIDAGGSVTTAKTKKTTMRNGGVEDCIVRQVQRMRFPRSKNGKASIVTFPFIFGQG